MSMTTKTPAAKVADRGDTDALVTAFLKRGGRVDRAPRGESGNGYTAKEWSRAERGLKVATGEEVAAERNRRAVIAVGNKDWELALALLEFRFDKEIKFDIESDRLGEMLGGAKLPRTFTPPPAEVEETLEAKKARLRATRESSYGALPSRHVPSLTNAEFEAALRSRGVSEADIALTRGEG